MSAIEEGLGRFRVEQDEQENDDSGVNTTRLPLMEQVTMDPPPLAVYSSLEELLVGGNNWAVQHGYKLVVVRSKTNAAGQKTWVHLACDRHGTKRNTHNLTPETRKKNRRSRRCECPMFCVAAKTNGELWELNTRHIEHNHGPYEPPQPKKKDIPKPFASELVNLPALQTPSTCIADFCLIPIGTSRPSVANEVAEVQRLLKRTGLTYQMHSAGTTIEGSWDEVTRFIGQAHSLLHGSGIIRIHNHISIGTRTDKKQGFQDKVLAVESILSGIPREDALTADDDDPNGDDHDESSLHDMDSSMVETGDPNIQPGLDQHRIMPHAPMQTNMSNMAHALQQQMQNMNQHQMSPSGHQMHQGHHGMQQHQHQQHQMSGSPHPLSQSMSM